MCVYIFFLIQDPFVAIVIDPVRTISAGKVNLGAFRTYPKGKKQNTNYLKDKNKLKIEGNITVI